MFRMPVRDCWKAAKCGSDHWHEESNLILVCPNAKTVRDVALPAPLCDHKFAWWQTDHVLQLQWSILLTGKWTMTWLIACLLNRGQVRLYLVSSFLLEYINWAHLYRVVTATHLKFSSGFSHTHTHVWILAKPVGGIVLPHNVATETGVKSCDEKASVVDFQ